MNKNTDEKIKFILEDLDENNITSLLIKWSEIDDIKKALDGATDILKIKIKTFLKDRGWNRFVDKETKISVNISKTKTEIFDKKQLKLMLTEAQLAQVIRISTSESLSIFTPEQRKRLKEYVKKKFV